MRDLGTLAGDSSSGAAINRNSHIVGASTINTFDNRQHASLWDWAMHDLGAPNENRAVLLTPNSVPATFINVFDSMRIRRISNDQRQRRSRL